MSQKKGVLYKKGRGTLGGFVSWKPRFCVLSSQDGSFRYYTDESQTRALGGVDLTVALEVRPVTVRKSAFQLTNSYRTWWFAAKTDQERDEWIAALKAVADKTKETPRKVIVPVKILGFGANQFNQLAMAASNKQGTIPTSEVISIACGSDFVIAVGEEGYPYGWGNSANGRLALLSAAAPDASAGAPTNGASITPATAGDPNAPQQPANSPPPTSSQVNAPTPIPLSAFGGAKIKWVACGKANALALTSQDQVFSWGQAGPALGLGPDITQDITQPVVLHALKPTKVLKIECSQEICAAITDVGKVYVWGRCEFLEPNGFDTTFQRFFPEFFDVFEDSQTRVEQIKFGGTHCLLLLENRQVWSMGLGMYGQLGLGTFENSPKPKRIDGLVGLNVKNVYAGFDYSFCVTEDGQAWAWGNGSRGNLGIDFTKLATMVTSAGLPRPDLSFEARCLASPCPLTLSAPATKIVPFGASTLYLIDGQLHVSGVNVLGADSMAFELPTVLNSPTGEKLHELAAGPDFFMALINGKVSPTPTPMGGRETVSTPRESIAVSTRDTVANSPRDTMTNPNSGSAAAAAATAATAVTRPRGTVSSNSVSPQQVPGKSMATASMQELLEKLKVLENENSRLKGDNSQLQLQLKSSQEETQLLVVELQRLQELLQSYGIASAMTDSQLAAQNDAQVELTNTYAGGQTLDAIEAFTFDAI